MRIGSHPGARAQRAKEAFLEDATAEEVRQREAEIAALDRKQWHGTTVYRLRCLGPFGRGPHDQWVTEGVLWALMSLTHFICPFHR